MRVGQAMVVAVGAMSAWGALAGCAAGGGDGGGEGGALATGGQNAGGAGGMTTSSSSSTSVSDGGAGGAGGVGGVGGTGGQGGDVGPCLRCSDRLTSDSLEPCPGTSAELWDAYWGCMCEGTCASACGDNACQGAQESGDCQTCRLEYGVGCAAQYNACLND